MINYKEKIIMRMQLLSIACAAALGLGFTVTTPVALAQTTVAAVPATAPAAPNLHAAMRSLWHGHIVTTRDYALAVFAGNKTAANKSADSVVANAKQIANAVAGFYGKDAGGGLLKLLAGHWGAVKALTDSAKSKSVAGEDKAMNELGVNAGAIAKFLAGANPNWKESDLDSALLMHGGDHRKQVDLMMSRAPKGEQGAAWTEMQHHMDMIADALADGIAKQFPDKAN